MSRITVVYVKATIWCFAYLYYYLYFVNNNVRNTHLKRLIIDGRPRKPNLLFVLCVCVTVNWVAAQPKVRDLKYRTVQLVNSWLSSNLHWNGLEVRLPRRRRLPSARREDNGMSAREPRYGRQTNEISAADGAWNFLRSLIPNLYFPDTFYS